MMGGLKTGGQHRYLALDAVRGCAAVCVVIYHLGLLTSVPQLARYGSQAVDLFFMLSGFVIGNAYEAKLIGGLGWAAYLRARLARLYPAIFLGLALSCIAGWMKAPDAPPLSWKTAGEFLLLPSLTGGTIFPLNPPFWSLFFELAANAVHAGIVRFLGTTRLAGMVALSAIFYLAAARYYGRGNLGYDAETFLGGFPRVAFGYGIGILIYRVHRSGRLRIPRVPLFVILGAEVAVFAIPDIGSGSIRFLISLFFVLPVLTTLAVCSPAEGWQGRASRWLGELSYPLYAIHWPVIIILGAYVERRGSRWPWAMVGVGLLLAANVVERVYDSPVRRWLRQRAAARER